MRTVILSFAVIDSSAVTGRLDPSNEFFNLLLYFLLVDLIERQLCSRKRDEVMNFVYTT